MRLILVASLLFSVSCGSTTTSYVGTVAGTDIAVGLVSDGSNVALFFCGGPSSFATSTKWFRFAGDAASFQATADTWSAVGSTNGSIASGTVNRGDGALLSWSAALVDDASIVGLYESIDDTGTAGIVVRSATDASQAQGAFIEKNLTVEQIIPIFPFDLEPNGLHVTIAGQDAFVPRALP